ncbi:MAG: response regulator [Chloroflexi bacterium]|nr:response regulator [Chloroflexota bacterium]
MESRDRNRRARILLADDEDTLRAVLTRVLKRQGWEVVAVNDGPPAVAAWPEDGEPFDLVILDIRMPRLSGDRVYEVLHERRPSPRFLFITGFSSDEGVQRVREWNLPLLIKPFDINEFVALAKSLLNGSDESAVEHTVDDSPAFEHASRK